MHLNTSHSIPRENFPDGKTIVNTSPCGYLLVSEEKSDTMNFACRDMDVEAMICCKINLLPVIKPEACLSFHSGVAQSHGSRGREFAKPQASDSCVAKSVDERSKDARGDFGQLHDPFFDDGCPEAWPDPGRVSH